MAARIVLALGSPARREDMDNRMYGRGRTMGRAGVMVLVLAAACAPPPDDDAELADEGIVETEEVSVNDEESFEAEAVEPDEEPAAAEDGDRDGSVRNQKLRYLRWQWSQFTDRLKEVRQLLKKVLHANRLFWHYDKLVNEALAHRWLREKEYYALRLAHADRQCLDKARQFVSSAEWARQFLEFKLDLVIARKVVDVGQIGCEKVGL
jgi:hypothetical protein